MVIADTLTYGNYFTLPGKGPYRIVLEIERAQVTTTAVFEYEH
jgi:hypothetical protein